jgi:hypothetical protein
VVVYFFYAMSLTTGWKILIMTYVGSNNRLNAVIGVAEIISLTIGLETEYNNKIFKSNLIIKKESTGLLYITDGVTQLSALPSVTDEVANYLNQHISDNTIHITPEVTEQLNKATVNVNRLSRTVDDISTTVESHINNADLHLSAATIASTYATKEELIAVSNIDISTFPTSEQFNQHINDESIHVSASTISDTYATKAELTEHITNADSTYATKAEVDGYATSDDLDNISTSIASTYATKAEVTEQLSTIEDIYATKDEVTNQLNTYATKDELTSVETSITDHTNNSEIHLTSEDRKSLQSIGNNTQLQPYELDEIIISFYK